MGNIPNINESGNPIDYYFTIINYLNANNVNILPIRLIDTADKKYIENQINLMRIKNKPDIILIEIIDEESRYVSNKNINLNIFGVNYKLDSAIVRDTNKQHFCALLTCNNNQFAFDGASYNKFTQMKWKDLLNKNEMWKFQGHDLTWNFRNSYQMLFYYRID